jgi:hypothetical protein
LIVQRTNTENTVLFDKSFQFGQGLSGVGSNPVGNGGWYTEEIHLGAKSIRIRT